MRSVKSQEIEKRLNKIFLNTKNTALGSMKFDIKIDRASARTSKDKWDDY